jgi:hypothetical protein
MFSKSTTNKSKKRALRGWDRLDREQLLQTRICDLGLKIKGSPLEQCINQVYRELGKRGFSFRPHFWLSDEWYCPDGVPGVAIPFFLAHPRLRRLEKYFLLEVDGGTRNMCMKLLRHESGHALLNAYRLDKRKDWRAWFGNPNARYPDTYLPKPYSKRFVLHLPNWYAQAHPHEDWAETFAVWLQPNSDWRTRYQGWPALKKLEFVHQLMAEIKSKSPRLTNKSELYPVEKIRMTLGEYYERKLDRYGADSPEFFNLDLRKLFSDAPEFAHNEKASAYIKRVRAEIIEVVERWTGEYKYRINEVMVEMVQRSDALKLRVTAKDDVMKPEFTACLTMLVMNKLHSEGFHISL